MNVPIRRVLPAVCAFTLALAACAPGARPATPTAPPIVLAPVSGSPAPTVPAGSAQQLGLTGHLLLAQGTLGIADFDLKTGTSKALFIPPENGIVNTASLSPDGKRIVMSYSPPPEPNKPQFGYTRLFLIPADGSGQPQPALKPEDDTGLLFQFPNWSPDGSFIYFGHFSPQAAANASGFQMQRVAYPGGKPEVLVDNALSGRLSPDGSHLVYISVDPVSGLNGLYLAEPDGKNARALLQDGQSWIIDAPIFSPDGASIIFSGVASQPTSLSPLDRWLGLRVASAHTIPSDLWIVPASGGKPRLLAHVSDIGMFPGFAPDGKHIAYQSQGGLYVMNADGSGLVRISDQGALGTLEWLP